jgi:hypothetical protein
MQKITSGDKIHIIQAREPSLKNDGEKINLIIRENITPNKAGPKSFKVGARRFKQEDVGLIPFEGIVHSSWVLIVRADECTIEDAKQRMQDLIMGRLTERTLVMKKQLERADVLLGSGMAFTSTSK